VFPAATCGSPSLPSMNIMDIINAVPGQIHGLIQDAARTNAFLGRVLAYNGIDGLEVEADSALVQGFRLSFDTADAVWLVGCWPPQRYAVVSGRAWLPRGSLTFRAAGLEVLVSFADFTFYFDQLRAEIECHGGTYILQGMGTGQGSGALRPERLRATGGVTVGCGNSWAPWCMALRAQQERITAQVLASVPSIVAGGLSQAHPLPLGPGCPGMLHNTMSTFAFNLRECCEAAFSMNGDGRLSGGQFNGRVYGAAGAAGGVVCSFDGAAAWTARCDSVPGGYYKQSTAICREDDAVPAPWRCAWCSPAWALLRAALCLLLVLVAVFVGLLVLCCYRRCGALFRRRKKHCDTRYDGLLAIEDGETWPSGH